MPKSTNQHTRSRYDLAAPVYNVMEWPMERFLFRKWRKQLWNQVGGREVLEIGVGTGKNLPWYPDGTRVTGIDLSPGMLQRARTYLGKNRKEGIEFREADAQDLPFTDDSFDTAVATFAFCSVPDPVLGLKEALRVTRPGGQLLLLEHMLSTRKPLAILMKKVDSIFHYLTGVHIARHTVENVRQAGWDIETVHHLTANGIFRMITARKPY